MRALAIHSLSAALGASLLASTALAHEREFTRSRDWHLPFRGEHEFELRSFFDTTHGDFRGQLEYEYGFTQNFAFEPGLEVEENEDGHYEVEAAELELRFNFGEFRRGKWLQAFNLEYEHAFEDEDSDRLELKSVLSRYGERDDFTINLNYGRELEGERESESELTAGWARRLGGGRRAAQSGLKLGLEAVQDFEEHHLQAGPLIAWRPSAHLNLLASYLPAIDERHDGNFDQLTVIVEWEL
jgi:hypothetical protein